MRHLLRVELTRLRWRRAVLVLLALALAVPVVVGAAIAWQTRPVSAADQASAERQSQAENDRPRTQRQLDRCVARPDRYGPPRDVGAPGSEQAETYCAEMTLSRPEYYLDRSPLRLDRVYDDAGGLGVASVVALLLLLVGTTFAGHDWNTGSMSNQLLFDSRRIRVWTGKALALGAVAFVVAALALGLFWGGLGLTASAWDAPVPDGTWTLVWAQAWRGVVLGVAAAIGGYALTMLLRSTVATLGILFVVTLVGPLLLTMTGVPGATRLMPQNHLVGWLDGPYLIQDYSSEECYAFNGDPDGRLADRCLTIIERRDAAAYFGGLLLLTSVGSVLSFRRRDVP